MTVGRRLSPVFIVLIAAIATATSFSRQNAQQDAARLIQTGRPDEALAALQLRMQANPADAQAYNLMCRAYFQMDRWDDAIHAGEKSVSLKPDNSEYHQWLGRSYGRKAEAAGPVGALVLVRKLKNEFERAVALDAENLSARADLSEFYTEAPALMGGDKTKARQLAAYVAQRNPAMGHLMLARIEEKHDKATAEAEFKAAIRENSKRAESWTDLAAFYRRTGRLDEMQSAVDQGVTAPQHEGVVLFNAGSLLLAAGRNFPVAVQTLRAYLSLPADRLSEEGPTFETHYLLGLLLEKQGNNQAAAGEYRAALSRASEYKPAQDALARVSR
ncbi:MAG TPA: tetratricopeptide repeat protein [Candidatus Angelobacter sp.]|nr:tetratricopeptide repeat protein [Candidatus Angelobacter sp.]